MIIVAGLLAMTIRAGIQAPAQVVPTTYEAGHFYAVPEIADGRRLKLMIDTGGGGVLGMYWVTGTAAKRLHLETATCTLGKDHLTVAPLPEYKPMQGLPPPISAPWPASCGAMILIRDSNYDVDGQLGAGYLPGRVWTFDYPARRLSVQDPHWRPDPAEHAAPLGLLHNRMGRLGTGFVRIVIHVDGQPLDMLLDTGATAHPTPAGEKASGTPTVDGFGVTSYITTGVFNRWHQAHPDWHVVNDGDDIFGPEHATRLIEVPEVEIAGWSVGPVWFTERPDEAFLVRMSSMMDGRVEGAVGGNVFRHFVMTLDYPHETAYFRCVQGCTIATPPPAP